MSLLDQLWDDTVAGPRPENGLGKLRKQTSLGLRSSSGKEADGGNVRSLDDSSSSDVTRVTRSIMIVKPPGYQSSSPPVSPAGSTPPVSPFSESLFDFEEGLHRMHTRREMKLDSGALLLLTTCDI